MGDEVSKESAVEIFEFIYYGCEYGILWRKAEGQRRSCIDIVDSFSWNKTYHKEKNKQIVCLKRDFVGSEK